MNENENIIQELNVPLKTFRIFAIEKAIRSGKSPELLQALYQCLQTETDSECKMLLEHAVATIEERLGAAKNPTPSYDNEKILNEFANLKPQQQLDFIKKAPRKYFSVSGAESKIAKALNSKLHPVVTAELVRKCQNSWPQSLSGFLEKNLFSNSSALQLACLENIIQNNPEILQRNFEKLVLAKDPLIRAMAIRGLAKKHPSSAAEFLSECLRKGDIYGKLAALRVCSVMNFELVKDSLLELVFSEKDPKLLKIASAIIVANPDKEVPFRLCDQIAKTQNKRQKFLQDLLKKACEIIKLSEICENFQQYLASIQKYNLNVRAKYYIFNCATAYAESSSERKLQIAEIFAQKAKKPEMALAIGEIEKSHPDLLVDLLKPRAEVSDSASQIDTNQEENKKESPEQLLLKELLSSQSSETPCSLNKIDAAFKSQNPLLTAAAFRASSVARDDRWKIKAKNTVKSENEELVAAAFDYLAEIDSDSFLLLLRGFIHTPSILVRTTLLRNVCRISPEVSKELLISMLKDPSDKTREKALGSVIHFEFSSIREILTKYLSQEKEPGLISSCLSFYQANPVLESVFDLKQLEETSKFAKLFREARESLITILDEFGIANPEEVHQFLQDKQNKKEKDAEKADASEQQRLRSIKAKIDWGGISEKISDIGSALAALKMLFLAAAVVAAVFFFLTREDTPDPSTRKAVVTVPIAGHVQDYLLIVQKIDGLDGAMIGLTKDKKFIRALPRPGKLFLLDPGDKIKLRALPFKAAPDGTIIVKTISLKKEK